jgi:hypothetical protein
MGFKGAHYHKFDLTESQSLAGFQTRHDPDTAPHYSAGRSVEQTGEQPLENLKKACNINASGGSALPPKADIV